MSRGGVIVNRVHFDGARRSTSGRAGRARPRRSARRAPGGGVAANLADFDVLVRRDRETLARLRRRSKSRIRPRRAPRRGHQRPPGLAELAARLFAERSRRRRRSAAAARGSSNTSGSIGSPDAIGSNGPTTLSPSPSGSPSTRLVDVAAARRVSSELVGESRRGRRRGDRRSRRAAARAGGLAIVARAPRPAAFLAARAGDHVRSSSIARAIRSVSSARCRRSRRARRDAPRAARAASPRARAARAARAGSRSAPPTRCSRSHPSSKRRSAQASSLPAGAAARRGCRTRAAHPPALGHDEHPVRAPAGAERQRPPRPPCRRAPRRARRARRARRRTAAARQQIAEHARPPRAPRLGSSCSLVWTHDELVGLAGAGLGGRGDLRRAARRGRAGVRDAQSSRQLKLGR